MAARTKIARVFVESRHASAVDREYEQCGVSPGAYLPQWFMEWLVSYTISVGELILKLDHFFIEAPYTFFFAWSKVIQEIGSSLGISVFFTSERVRASSSNATVNMAPGLVHVPISI